MNENYIVLDVSCSRELSDILIAEFSQLEFDSFIENDNGFQCSVNDKKFNEISFLQILNVYRTKEPITYTKTVIINKDWNREWEKNFNPIAIEDKVLIRAPFHQNSLKYAYEILIQPKMSFGTGHHETTYLMIQAMLNINFENKRILDVGCGTGILSIMGEKSGASQILGIDIDDWAIINAQENVKMNNCSKIIIKGSTVNDLANPGVFNIILANINRNVLLEEIPLYSAILTKNGILILSGYYIEDEPTIEKTAIENNCTKVCQYARNRWSTLVFEKKTDYFS